MRNVILGVITGCLISLPGLPTRLGAQGVEAAVQWSAPCFPSGECRATTRQAPSWASPLTVPEPPAARQVHLWPHAVSALTTLALASTLDNQVQRQIQEHRGASGDDLARFSRRMGQPEVYAPVALGTVAVGLLAGDGRILRAGGRITGGLLVAGATVTLLKSLVGRGRPRFNLESHNFRPFSSQTSWPSGHTAMAFALATSVSDEVRFTPVTIALYGAATLTGWSRINDNRHWATDVAAGALVGVVSAKLMNGRWQVFGARAPAFLLEGNGVGMRLAF